MNFLQKVTQRVAQKKPRKNFIRYFSICIFVICVSIMTAYAFTPKDLASKMVNSTEAQEEIHAEANILRREVEILQGEINTREERKNLLQGNLELLKVEWGKHEGIINLANELIQLEAKGL